MLTIWDRIIQGTFWNPATFNGAVAYLLVFLLGAVLLAWFIRRVGNQVLRRDTHGILDRTAAYFLIQFAQVFVFIAAFILYAHIIPPLRSLGTALLTGVSVSAIVIGLAAQNTLGNFISGVSLLVYRPFRVGDRIQINAPTGLEAGTVSSIMLAYTMLETFDNRHILVPNSVIANQVTVNLTQVDPRAMAAVPISIGYSADVERARAILLDLAKTHPLVDEVVSCPVVQLGASSVDLSLRVWCSSAADAKQVEYDLYEQVKDRFAREHIEIPFPYTNVVLQSASETHKDDGHVSRPESPVSRNGLSVS